MPALTLSRARLCGSAQVPPSKSAVHRALISAALSTRPCRLMGFSFPLCDDIRATLNGITALGASVRLEENAILVTPAPAGRRSNAPTAHCHVYASASSLRMLIPVFLAKGQPVTFTLEQGLARRPLDAFDPLLARLGAVLKRLPDTADGFAALHLEGFMPAGAYQVDGSLSSQFASGMLLALTHATNENGQPAPSTLTVTGPIVSRPYLDLTLSYLREMGLEIQERQEGVFALTPSACSGASAMTMPADWSQAAVFLCVNAMGGGIMLQNMALDDPHAQGDAGVLDILRRMGMRLYLTHGELYAVSPSHAGLMPVTIDCTSIPDLAPILALTCTQARGDCVLTGVSRLRAKECDRLAATRDLLGQLGVTTDLSDDQHVLTIHGPARLRGGFQADARGDHRMAMFVAAAALLCDQPITLIGWESVSKSWPTFWDTYRALGGIAK